MSPISNRQKIFPRNHELESPRAAYGREDFTGVGAYSKAIQGQQGWVGPRVHVSKMLPVTQAPQVGQQGIWKSAG